MVDTAAAQRPRQSRGRAHSLVRRFVADVLLPSAIYLATFVSLTGGLILQFSNRFFADAGDGLQNVWNLWWVDRAVTVLHQSPWWTSLLHYPHGTSLVAHTLNPFNGLLAIGLLPFLSLVQTYNAIVVFSFVAGGVGAYLLARYLGRGRAAALLAGFIFTFSNYHFAHATGHLQLVALEWIPVFVLAFLHLLDRPRVGSGIAAGVVLALVLLCDYYYFFFCVLGGAAIAAVTAWERRDWLFLLRPAHRSSILTFVATALVTCAPLTVALLVLGVDGLIGGHFAREYSLDLFGLLIPGGHWRFAELTRGYWENLPGNIHESSVYLGFAACTLLGVSFVEGRPWRRRGAGTPGAVRMPYFTGLWFVLISFAVLSLGPVLHIWGLVVPMVKLPYGVFGRLLPPLRSGCPGRMTVMVALAAGVLIAEQVERMLSRTEGGRKRWQPMATVALLGVLLVEFLPAPMTTVKPIVPGWVEVLATQPKARALYDIDDLENESAALYYQTIHQVPMVGGYLARVPSAVDRRDRVLRDLAHAGQLRTLCERYGIGYVLARPMPDPPPLLYTDGRVALYDLTRNWDCRATRD